MAATSRCGRLRGVRRKREHSQCQHCVAELPLRGQYGVAGSLVARRHRTPEQVGPSVFRPCPVPPVLRPDGCQRDEVPQRRARVEAQLSAVRGSWSEPRPVGPRQVRGKSAGQDGCGNICRRGPFRILVKRNVTTGPHCYVRFKCGGPEWPTQRRSARLARARPLPRAVAWQSAGARLNPRQADFAGHWRARPSMPGKEEERVSGRPELARPSRAGVRPALGVV